MEPEVLDEFCQRKLSQLSQVPDLEWEEEKVWQKIQPQLRGGFFNFRYLSALLILVGIVGWYTLNRRDARPVLDHTQTQGTTQAIAKADQTEPAGNAVKPSGTKGQAVKEAFFRASIADSTKPLSNIRPLAGKPLRPQTKLPAPTTRKTLPQGSPQQRQALAAPRVATDDVVQDKLAGSRKRKEREHYLASGENGLVTGVRQVWHVSRRVSLVHGLQVMQPYTASLPLERPAGLQMDYTLQLPLEVRYYLLPKEKRFTAFLYGSVVPSLALSQPTSLVSGRPVDLSLQAGAEARVRLFSTQRGSSAFFFMRTPVYQRSLLPGPPAARD